MFHRTRISFPAFDIFFITSLQSNIALEIILTPFSAETHKQDEENPCFCLHREELRTPLKHAELICRNTGIDSTQSTKLTFKAQIHIRETHKTPQVDEAHFP